MSESVTYQCNRCQKWNPTPCILIAPDRLVPPNWCPWGDGWDNAEMTDWQPVGGDGLQEGLLQEAEEGVEKKEGSARHGMLMFEHDDSIQEVA